uniref:Putative metalloproteinase inhibitor 3 n=1 Tax=Lutzomyia longipalpis TaxID=7200 RepID=A0A1B0CJ48_LUTLO
MDKTVIFCFIAVFGVLLLSASTDACSCALEHTQTKICNSEFSVIARVLGRYVRPVNRQIVYKLQILKIYKMKDSEPHPLKIRRIVTSSQDSTCMVDLKPGRTLSPASQMIAPPMEGTCNWSYMSPCETNYGVCTPSRGKLTPDGKPTKCHWKRSSPYMSCIMMP